MGVAAWHLVLKMYTFLVNILKNVYDKILLFHRGVGFRVWDFGIWNVWGFRVW